MKTTPDLTSEYYPIPKTFKGKKPIKRLGQGSRTRAWSNGVKDLKEVFAERNIFNCEINLEGCVRNNYLGFAHVMRRVNYTDEELADPHNVVLACQPCHNTVDNEIRKDESEKLLLSIVKSRGW